MLAAVFIALKHALTIRASFSPVPPVRDLALPAPVDE
jgi:hypothetical protein